MYFQNSLQLASVQFSCSVMSDSLRPPGLQHARLPCLLPTPGAYSNSCPSSWWCHPTISVVPSFSSIRVFSNESVLCNMWPKYWSFSFSSSPSNEYSGLISFRMDWLDLLAVQGTLKSLLQNHSSKAWSSAFFEVQLSPSYMTTRKTTALTRQTFAGKTMSLLFNMLSRFVGAFLPRSKCLLISLQQSPTAVLQSLSLIVSPSICHEVMGPDAIILVFWMLTFKPTFKHNCICL